MLYEDVAQRLERLIQDGTLLPGHRLPSVRHLRDRWGVSVATAQHAFRVLETRGLVEARPRSGYFVRDTPRLWLPAPEPTAPLPEDERLRGLSVLRETATPDLVARFDYYRFRTPSVPENLQGVDLTDDAGVTDAELRAFLGFD